LLIAVSIVDWDHEFAVPLQLSVVSTVERLARVVGSESVINSYNDSQSSLYQQELQRIEREQSSSDVLSQLYLSASENMFMDNFLLFGNSLPQLHDCNPDVLEEALEWSHDALVTVRSEWEHFVDDFYTSRRRALPDWPQYVEIQKGLGMYGRFHFPREFKKKAQVQLARVFGLLCRRFPRWKWATLRHCYFTSALSDKYELPSGGYSC
jgi:hypothetical protein